MPFNKLKFAMIAAAAIAAGHAMAQPAPSAPANLAVPQSPTAPKAPTAPVMASSGLAQPKPADALPGMPDGPTLRQLEVIQRKVAVIKAKKSFREQERTQNEVEAQDAPPVPMVRAPNGQMMPANMMPPPPTPQEQMAGYRVLSTVTFGGKTSADISNGGLVTTVKVGDSLGSGRVTNIRDGGVVTVSLTTSIPTTAPAGHQKVKRKGARSAASSTEIKTVSVDLQRAYDVNDGGNEQMAAPGFAGAGRRNVGGVPAPRLMPPQMAGFPSMPPGVGQVPASAFSADAMSVPIIGQPAVMPGSMIPGSTPGMQ